MKRPIFRMFYGAFLVICTVFLFTSCSGTEAAPVNTDAEAVSAAKDALAITYAAGDSAAAVTKNLTLPVFGANGVAIAWTSSSAFVTDSGEVKRPGDVSEAVTMTATLTKGSSRDTKVFPLTLYGENQEKVDAVKEKLSIKLLILNSENNITLPQSLDGYDDVEISWTSSDTGIIGAPNAETASVSIPQETVAVTVTATIKPKANDAKAETSKEFSIKVYAANDNPSADDCIAAAMDSLAITYAAGDSAASVKKNLTLPGSGGNDVAVSWAVESGKESWCTPDGKITRDLTDIPVRLTATLSKSDGTPLMKTFDIIVSPITEFQIANTKFSFNGNELVQIQYSHKFLNQFGGAKYAYTIDAANRKLTVTQTAHYSYDYFAATGEWITRSDFIRKQTEGITAFVDRAITLTGKNPVTHADVVALFRAEMEIAGRTDLSDEKVKSYIISHCGSSNYFSVPFPCANVKEFDALPTDKLKSTVEKYLALRLSLFEHQSEIRMTNWQEIKSQIGSIVRKAEKMKFKDAVFTYKIECDEQGSVADFHTETDYDNSKKWYEQYGIYQNEASYALECYGRQTGLFSIPDNTEYSVIFNSEISSFTYEKDNTNFSWSITVNADKTITITNLTTPSEFHVLTFKGRSL